jgi:hypothetical protein
MDMQGAAAVAVLSRCLWRHRKMVTTFRTRYLKGRSMADTTPGNDPADQKEEPEG